MLADHNRRLLHVQGPGEAARAAAARKTQQEDADSGGQGRLANGVGGSHAVGNGSGVDGGKVSAADAREPEAANGIERVEVELLDGSAKEAKTLGARLDDGHPTRKSACRALGHLAGCMSPLAVFGCCHVQ